MSTIILVSALVPPSARRFAIPFVGFTTVGFVAGAAFTHYIAFPYMMAFFATFNTPDLIFMPRLEDVFDLYTKMVLGMAVVFQMPTVVFFLSKMGLITPGFLWRSFRYAFLLIFIAAAVITPTGDMVTQTIFAAPMVGLYALSIVIAWIFGRPRVTADDAHLDRPGVVAPRRLEGSAQRRRRLPADRDLTADLERDAPLGTQAGTVNLAGLAALARTDRGE